MPTSDNGNLIATPAFVSMRAIIDTVLDSSEEVDAALEYSSLFLYVEDALLDRGPYGLRQYLTLMELGDTWKAEMVAKGVGDASTMKSFPSLAAAFSAAPELDMIHFLLGESGRLTAAGAFGKAGKLAAKAGKLLTAYGEMVDDD